MPDIVSLKLLGVAGVLSYAVARFATKAGIIGYRRYILVSVPVSEMPAMPRGFSIRPMAADELRAHVIDVPEATQKERYTQGLTCLGAFNPKGALVGVTWVGSSDFTESEIHVRFALPRNAGWDCGLWIAPHYRLGRAFAALWCGTADWMRQNGCDRSISWIADYNLPSLLSHRRMGADTIGYLTAFRFFSWQYIAQGKPKLLRVDARHPTKLDLNSIAAN